jgi:SAM-dependent methyltransferase
MDIGATANVLNDTVGSDRKRALAAHFDALAVGRERWVDRNRYFYDDEVSFLRFLVPPSRSVLELGCGTGRLLAALDPARGVGVDISAAMVGEARRRHPELEFHVGDLEDESVLATLGAPFDYVLIVDTVGYLDDVQGALAKLHALCKPSTRLVVAYFSQGWRPVLALAARFRLRMPVPAHGLNWLSSQDLAGMLQLAGFELVRREWRTLVPRRLGGIGPVLNAIAGALPGLRRLGLRDYVVARQIPSAPAHEPSVSIVIPCRNEAGNVRPALERLPRLAPRQEVLFVEGHSTDGTAEVIKDAIAERPEQDIALLTQPGVGKADAVRLGFAQAQGDILLILDGDLTVAPEDLPKFYAVLRDRRGDFVNGTRLVYPLGVNAMRPLNKLANRSLALLFSCLLNQRMTDTLCGTKGLYRTDYTELVENRSYFGDFDPYGDFDLLLGASRLGLKFVEIPVRYSGRRYGATNIARFRDGVLLARMVAFAWRKMKDIS